MTRAADFRAEGGVIRVTTGEERPRENDRKREKDRNEPRGSNEERETENRNQESALGEKKK